MKTKILLVTLSTIMLGSCKYEEGPALSLRSKKARIAGEWEIEKLTLNDQDITSSFMTSVGGEYTVHFEKDGSYHIHALVEEGGTWSLADGKKELHTLSSAAGAEEEHYEILKLKNKEMWLRHEHSSTEVYEYHYKQ